MQRLRFIRRSLLFALATAGLLAVVLAGVSTAMSPSQFPRIQAIERLSDGTTRLHLAGETGRPYILQRSTNLVDWLSIATNRFTEEGGIWTDSHGVANGSAYYRLLEFPGTAADHAGEAAIISKIAKDLPASPQTAVMLSSPTNLPGLQLWIEAGKVALGTGGTNLAWWPDQSGLGHHGSNILNPAFLPAWVTNAVNGRPVVRFDGVNDFLSFTKFMTGTLAGEVMVVLRSSASPGSERSLWRFGAFGTSYPNAAGQVWDGFGSSSSRNLGVPPVALTNAHLFNVSAASGFWQARFNGQAVFASTNNTVTFGNEHIIGLGSYYFSGDIAEVLMFNRVLTGVERGEVEAYLNERYALVSAPPPPTGLTARAVSESEIFLSWNGSSGAGKVVYVIERRTGTDGGFEKIAEVAGVTNYVSGPLEADMPFGFRIKAVSLGAEGGYSEEAAARTLTVAPPMTVGGLRLWLRGDAGQSSPAVGWWRDQSGLGNHATQAVATARPELIFNELAGRPVVHFDGTNDQLKLGESPATNSFTVMALARPLAGHEIDGEDNGQYSFGGALGQRYLLGGTVNGSAFGEAGLSLGTNGASTYEYGRNETFNDHFAPLAVYGSPLGGGFQILTLLYRAQTPELWVNGARVRVGLPSSRAASMLSRTIGSGQTGSGLSPFSGDLAELLVFDRALSASELDDVGRYLNRKYQALDFPTESIVLEADALSGTQVLLSWKSPGDPAGLTFRIERRLGANGDFAAIGDVRGVTRFLDTNALPQSEYTYRIRYSLDVIADRHSNEFSILTSAGGEAWPLDGVALWLRADDVLADNGAAIGEWQDIFRTSRKAAQVSPASRPHWIAGAMQQRAALRFDGTARLNLSNLLATATNAEMFVVLRAATNRPSGDNHPWQFGSAGPASFPAADGRISDAFGSASSHEAIPPLPVPTEPCLYHVAAEGGVWRLWLNGVLRQVTPNNQLQFDRDPVIGGATDGLEGGFFGDISEIIILDRALDPSARWRVRDYLARRYALALSRPQVPENFAVSVTTNGVPQLTWTPLPGSGNGLNGMLVVERQIAGSGSFVALHRFGLAASGFIDEGVLSGPGYRYRLHVFNDLGEAVGGSLAAEAIDSDGDGLPDWLELKLGTNPFKADTDGDGLPDGWEVLHELNPRRAIGRDGAAGDPDGDGITNLARFLGGGNPGTGIRGDPSAQRLQVHRPN